MKRSAASASCAPPSQLAQKTMSKRGASAASRMTVVRSAREPSCSWRSGGVEDRREVAAMSERTSIVEREGSQELQGVSRSWILVCTGTDRHRYRSDRYR